MPIHPKNFSYTEMIRRIIFGGRPKYFNAKDLTKAFDMLNYGTENISKIVGASGDVVMNYVNYLEAGSGVNKTVTFNWNTSAGYVDYNGMRYVLPAFIGVHNGTYTGTADVNKTNMAPPIYFVLVGNIVEVDFATNPTLCGLQSDEYPNIVPAVDVEQYQNVAVIVTNNPSSIANKICIIGVITNVVNNLGALQKQLVSFIEPEVISEYTEGNTLIYPVNVSQGNGSLKERIKNFQTLFLNRMKPNYLESTLNLSMDKKATLDGNLNIVLQKGNVHTLIPLQLTNINGIIPHSSYREGTPLFIKYANINSSSVTFKGLGTGGTFATEDNQGIVMNKTDMLCVVGIIENGSYVWYIANSMTLGLKVRELNAAITAVEEDLQAQINALEIAVNKSISNKVTLPIGGIAMYSGNLAGFDSSGKGVSGEYIGWALCNGNIFNGHQSPDLRGRFIVGAIQIPNLDAPELEPVVKPGVEVNGITNSDYAIDDKGGEPNHLLTGEQSGLAKHNHKVNEPNDGSGHAHNYSLCQASGNHINDGSYSTYGVSSNSDAGTTLSVSGITLDEQPYAPATVGHENRPPFYAVAYIVRIPLA